MTTFRRCAAVAALTLCAMTGACSGENPAATPSNPSVPRLDGASTNNTTTAADSGSTATNRGGVTFGSGG